MSDPAPSLPVSESPSLPRPRILAILNCFAPDGANRAQIVIRADGAAEIHGDEPTLLKAPLAALRGIDLRKFGNHRRGEHPRRDLPSHE